MFKKFAKTASALIVCVLAVISCCFVTFADSESPNDHGSGGGQSAASGSVHTGIIAGWKVSLYVGNEGATKYSSIDSFTLKNMKVFWHAKCCRSGYSGEAIGKYVSRGDKIYMYAGNKFDIYKKYKAGDYSFYDRTITRSDLIEVKDANFPKSDVWQGNKGKLVTDANKITSFFVTNGYNNVVKKLDSSVKENDTWLIVYEPMIHCYNSSNGHRIFYTPTEYAFVVDATSNAFSSNKIHNGSYPNGATLQNGSRLVYPGNDKAFLQMGTSDESIGFIQYNASSYRNQYGNASPWAHIKSSIIRLGGVGYTFSKTFNYPDYSIGSMTFNNNIMEGKKQTVKIEVKSDKIFNANTPVQLYIGSTKVKETTVNFNDSTTKTITFDNVDFGAYGTKTMEVKINPNFNSPNEITTNNNSASKTIYVQRPNFNVSLSTSDDNPYENDTITVTATVNLDTYGAADAFTSKVGVKLDYNGTGHKLKNAQTKTVTLSNSSKSATVTWQLQVGTYSQTSNDAIKELKATITPSDFSLPTQELNTNDNFTTKGITLKRDMIVTSISVDRNSVFENEDVNVTFKIKNNNPYRAYDNLPVMVYFKDPLENKTKLAQTTVSLAGGAERECKIKVNVGCVTSNADQNDTIYVAFNYNYPSAQWSTWHESGITNNLKSVNVKVKRDINLSIKLVNPNASYSANATCVKSADQAQKTQAVTSCIVYNDSRFNLYGANPMKDTLTVIFYVNGSEVGRKNTVLPANGSNLVFFKWNIPESAQANLSVSLVWNVNQENSPNPQADNSSAISQQIVTVNKFSTPDTSFLKDKNGSNNYFTANAYVKRKPYIAKWSQWVCDNNGKFTLVKYALSAESSTVLTPMQSAQYSSGSTIAAGSAFSANFSYNIKTECSDGNYAVKTSDYTYVQNAVASFPEFQ